MAYIAIKPCTFASQSFRIGDTIPDGLIHPENARNLTKMGIVAERSQGDTPTTAQTPAPATVAITIHDDSGEIPLNVTPGGLQAVFDVLCAPVASAEGTISGMTDDDALILLHAADSRKSVKEAVRARAEAISAAEAENGGEA